MSERELPPGIIAGSGTILLVDDEEMILEVGKGMLETLGYKVLTAKGGREAVEIYGRSHETVDLVVLDLVMPDMDGGETYRQLKAIHPGIRVLVSSGFSIDTMARGLLDEGCSGFIQKPFFIKELSSEVAKIISPR